MKPLRLRTGRKVGRTLYAQVHPTEASDGDRLVGMVDDIELASEIVKRYNKYSERGSNMVEVFKHGREAE